MNRLTDIFSKNELHYEGTLRFTDNKTKEDFLSKLSSLSTDTETLIEGVELVSTYSGDNYIKVPEMNPFKPNNIIIQAHPEDVELSFDVNGVNEHIYLERRQNDGEIYFINKNKEDILHHKMTFSKNNKLNISYEVNQNNAESVKDVIKAINIYLKFFESIIPRKNWDENGEIISSIKRLENYMNKWKIIEEIENHFGIEFKPTVITIGDKNYLNILRLYFLIVKDKVIKEELDGINLTFRIASNAKLPMEETVFGLAFNKEIEMVIYGNNIKYVQVNYLDDAFIKEVVKVSNDEIRIECVSTNEFPLIQYSQGYKKQEDLEQIDLNKIINKIKVQEPQTFDSLVSEIL